MRTTVKLNHLNNVKGKQWPGTDAKVPTTKPKSKITKETISQNAMRKYDKQNDGSSLPKGVIFINNVVVYVYYFVCYIFTTYIKYYVKYIEPSLIN